MNLFGLHKVMATFTKALPIPFVAPGTFREPSILVLFSSKNNITKALSIPFVDIRTFWGTIHPGTILVEEHSMTVASIMIIHKATESNLDITESRATDASNKKQNAVVDSFA